MKNIAIVISFFIPTLAYGDYFVTGEITGTECTGIGVKICGPKRVDAVKGKDGKFYEVTDHFKSVTKYDSSKNICTIRTKDTNGSVISWLTNKAIHPDFYHRSETGKFEKLDIEYVTFPCIKR